MHRINEHKSPSNLTYVMKRFFHVIYYCDVNPNWD